MLVSMLISLAIPTSGLVLVRDRYVQPYIWLYWLNPLQYALNALTSLVFYCDVNSPQVRDTPHARTRHRRGGGRGGGRGYKLSSKLPGLSL